MHTLLQKQRDFFNSGATLLLKTRITYLKRLRTAILQQQPALYRALYQDLGKSETEAYMCEVGQTLEEIGYFLKHLPQLARDRTVRTPLSNFRARSIIKRVPRGNVLILSPWNYPFLLSLEPLVDAIAAGNTVILKPSAYSPHTSAFLKELIQGVFPAEYAAVITGGREENKALLDQKFDYIFFTGSGTVGKEVLRRAAENLIPVSLELGGKSPCLVDESAPLQLTARRLVFGKFLNCGQTCVAPDYVLCPPAVQKPLVEALQAEIRQQFGSSPLQNPHYGRIVNEKHFNRLLRLLDSRKVAVGGTSDKNSLKIEPTVLSGVTWEDPVMQEEIFGPILPILTYTSLDEALRTVEERPHPLAFYVFSRDKHTVRRVTERCRFGGGCVNDVILHLATPYLPFGGVGPSGMGNYHGAFGFETFSHTKSILDKKFFPDLPARYQPYTKWKDFLLRLFLH